MKTLVQNYSSRLRVTIVVIDCKYTGGQSPKDFHPFLSCVSLHPVFIHKFARLMRPTIPILF